MLCMPVPLSCKDNFGAGRTDKRLITENVGTGPASDPARTKLPAKFVHKHGDAKDSFQNCWTPACWFTPRPMDNTSIKPSLL